MESCSNKPDLKKEAQRTNRFNSNLSQNSTPCSLTACNHLESSSKTSNDHKLQEIKDAPCISIILKPVLDPKTEYKDEAIQIVEITAVTENIYKPSTDSSNFVSLDVNNRAQTVPKETEEVKMKSVKVETEPENNCCDMSTQTIESPTDKCIGISVTSQTNLESTIGNVPFSQIGTDTDGNKGIKGVQFRDNRTVIDNLDNSKDNSSWNGASTCIINIDDSTTNRISEAQCIKTPTQETSVTPVECFDSLETLYKLINNNNSKLSKASDCKTCMKKMEKKVNGNLSERIKRNIDKLENDSYVSTPPFTNITNTNNEIGTEIDFLPCNDSCKKKVVQSDLFKTYSEKSSTPLADSSSAVTNTTLPSVFSNNSPIPRVTINTTGTIVQETPLRDNPSKVTVTSTLSNPCFHPGTGDMLCCSGKNFNTEDTSPSLRNVTSEHNYSGKTLYEQQYPENDGTGTNKSKKCATTKKNIQKVNGSTDTRSFWTNENTTFSKLGVTGNLSLKTNSTNTSNEMKPIEQSDHNSKENTLNKNKSCKNTTVGSNSISSSQTPDYSATFDNKFDERPEFMFSAPNTRNTITASDLTRPEFIRMLTELKEHTCSLEIQLSAMNEALKRKQASRSKALSSTRKDYEPIRQDHAISKTQTKKIKTANESECCMSEVSSVEYPELTTEEFQLENLMDTSSCCSHPDDTTYLNDSQDYGLCCEDIVVNETQKYYVPFKSDKKLAASSPVAQSTKPKENIIFHDESNISLIKHKSKKPVFKIRKSYQWAPLRQSDHRMWRNKFHKRTPSIKSMGIPEILSQSISPQSFMGKYKVDVSCSPTNCCDIPETSPIASSSQAMFEDGSVSPIRKPKKSRIPRSRIHSTSSNPSINRTTVRSSFMSSTPKKPVKASWTPKYRIVAESGSESDHKVPQASCSVLKSPDCAVTKKSLTSSYELDTSKNSNDSKNCSQTSKIEPSVEVLELTREHLVPTSPFKLKRSNVRPKLGSEHNFSKNRIKDHSAVISSNVLSPAASKESFYESTSKLSFKNYRTSENIEIPSSFKIKNLGVMPRLKLKSIRNKNPSHTYIETNNSHAHFDPACCSTLNDSDIASQVNIASPSNRLQSVPSEEILTKLLERHPDKNHFAYTITTEQNTPFLANNLSKFDSEEEVNCTNYMINKSDCQNPCKESIDNTNGKKRKRNYRGKELSELPKKSSLNNSSSQNFYHQEQSSCNLKHMKRTKAVLGQEFDNISKKSRESSLQRKDSKCTIRVTVSLDSTPSNEEVKKI